LVDDSHLDIKERRGRPKIEVDSLPTGLNCDEEVGHLRKVATLQ
jgi:hypothetical protein